ncbi:MAG: FAD-binding oxidoreductase [Candidatus Acidiferrales bacterium]
MPNRIDRREFIKQSAIATAVFSASPASLFGAGQARVRAGLKTVAEIEKAAIRKFALRLRGQALLPGDRNYESACRDWTGRIPNVPGLVVRCAGTEDVVAAVNFARDHGVLVAVRGGGHGLRSTDGGMLIDLSPMKKSAVNTAQRVARAEPGVTVGELDKATGPSRLAAVLGECPSVGISGFTLGGGFGRLMGQHGAACDNLLTAEIVTAEGKVLRASEGENADLFWGIRGGGGNFGIATAFEYRIHPVRQVLSGMLAYPMSAARAVLRFFGEYLTAAPDQLDALIEIGSGILQYAPDAQVPTVVVNVCCGGDLRAAEETLRPLRTFGPPTSDTVRQMSYLDAQGLGSLVPFLNHATPRYSGYFKTGFVTGLGDAAIDAIVAHCEKPPSGSWSVAFDHYLHGAICRVPESDMAFSLRQSGYSFRLTSYEEGVGQPNASTAWGTSLSRALDPFSGGRMYLNYLTDQDEEGLRAAVGSNYSRLAALKKTYDPTNFFRLNPNIEPAV